MFCWQCTLYNLVSPTRCAIPFNIFIYFSSLHVSGINLSIIRIKMLYLCDTGIFALYVWGLVCWLDWRCTILYNIFIYFSSVHVSGIHVSIIRRKMLYLCDTVICRSVWVASSLLVGLYRVTNTSEEEIAIFSRWWARGWPKHVEKRNK